MRTQLTDVSVRALKAPACGQMTVWDKSSPIGVRVSAGGAKTYIVMVGSGRRRTIGKVGVISLAEARGEAKRILAEKTLGLGSKPSTVTFAAALPDFLEDNYKGKKPRTKHEARRLLESHFLPAFRNRQLADITDRDIGRELDKLHRTPSEQLHAFRALRTMLKWCTRPPRRYIPYSPLDGYAPPGEDRKGTRVLTDHELIKIWRACEGQFGAMVRLLILWGTRNGETGRLKRAWIEDGILTIPGAFTKNGRAHAIPLLPMAKAILDGQPKRGSYYFPGRIGEQSHFNDGSWGKFKQELERRAAVTDWQLRDIRRTFRSNMAKLGVSRDIAEVLLNHVTGANKNDLDEIYNRYDYMAEKRESLAKWEARLTELLQRPYHLPWEVDFQGINVADAASGAGGDVTVSVKNKTLIAVEVTERTIDESRVRSTFRTKILPNKIDDYLFLFSGEKPSNEARDRARSYFAQGHEINFIPLRPWVMMFLTTLGSNGRAIFTDCIIGALDKNEVSASIKVAWNDIVREITG